MCDAKISPMRPINDVELMCGLEPTRHDQHEAVLKDYAFVGSSTVVKWFEDDRRNFRGDWQACDVGAGCTLPRNHRGACAA